MSTKSLTVLLHVDPSFNESDPTETWFPVDVDSLWRIIGAVTRIERVSDQLSRMPEGPMRWALIADGLSVVGVTNESTPPPRQCGAGSAAENEPTPIVSASMRGASGSDRGAGSAPPMRHASNTAAAVVVPYGLLTGAAPFVSRRPQGFRSGPHAASARG